MTNEAGPAPYNFSALTLADAVRQSTEALRAAGIEDPAAEARWLVAAAATVKPLDLVVNASRPLTPHEADQIAAYIQRRTAREPLSRIMGRREFYGRDFALSTGTLDPRPETEVLINVVLNLCGEPTMAGRPIEVLDIGTGTGAILITLLAELPQARGLGLDISLDALQTAARNAASIGVADRARFERVDVSMDRNFEDLRSARGYDFIVSNPPYIASADLSQLQPEVKLHDPVAALDGGPDGLDFYRILANFTKLLAPGGWLVVEVGAGQSDQVADLFLASAAGADLRRSVDLAGHTRIVALQPRPNRSGE